MKSIQSILSTAAGALNKLRVAVLLMAVMCTAQAAWARTAISTDAASANTPSGTAPAIRVVTMPAEPIGSGGGISYAGSHSSSVTSGGGGGQTNAFDTIINPGPTLSLPAYADALAAFNRAAAKWESHISDPITINIDADLASLPSGVLGSTNSVLLQEGFTDMRNAIVADAASEPDDAVVSHLPTLAQFSALLPSVTEGTFELDGNIVATKANFKALGYTDLDTAFGATDATITFSTNFSFDYDNSNGVDAGKWDFETIAVHEIGHALGFVSRLDYVDSLLDDPAATFATEDTVTVGIGALDMFGFADDQAGWDPATNTEFTNFPRLLTPGVDRVTDQLTALFDADAEMLMSEGRLTGDGRQASHWKDNNLTLELIGVMDPTFSSQQVIPIHDSDLRALDLIGYDISIPEPATMGLLAFGAAGILMRRRRVR
jgi:hypothetical protein